MVYTDALLAIGINRETASKLACAVEASPDGLLDAEDRAGGELVLHAALVASLEPRRFGDALHATTRWLESRVGQMSRYDAARFWHVRGVAAWRLDDAVFVAMRALNTSERLLTTDVSARARGYLARVHDTTGQLLHQRGLLGDARRELERALVLREATGDRAGEAITLGNLGRLSMDIGDFAAAREYLARDLAIVEEQTPDLPRVRAQLYSNLGDCELRLGADSRADSAFRTSGELSREAHDPVGETFAAIGSARIALARGDAKRALSVATDALSEVTRCNLPAPVHALLAAAVHKLAGDAQLALGANADAVACFRHATVALASAPHVSPVEVAEVHRGLAHALAAGGDLAESSRSLRDALRQLDATAADALRRDVEHELQSASHDAWLLHSIGRFLGHQQIDTLLAEAGQQGFRGARRRVLVLFSDLRGFTTLSERLEADALVSLLNDFLALMTACIESHGGIVDKFIGDAVMAVFPYESDGGTRAIRAAMAMHGELERFARRVRIPGVTLGMGIGLHAGDVIGGLIGSPQKRELTVIGDVVNTASRIEGMTKQLGATTLVTDEVLAIADRARFLVRPLGRFAPKGRSGAVRVHDVHGERGITPDVAALGDEIARAEIALAAFHGRDFARAARLFEELAGAATGTARVAGYALLAAKSYDHMKVAPGAEWRGEIVLAEK